MLMIFGKMNTDLYTYGKSSRQIYSEHIYRTLCLLGSCSSVLCEANEFVCIEPKCLHYLNTRMRRRMHECHITRLATGLFKPIYPPQIG